MKFLRRSVVAGLVAFAVAAPLSFAHADDPKDIVEIAKGAGTFTSLVKALETAGLVETLKRDGPFTVFAPTDEAFAKLPDGVFAIFIDGNHNAALKTLLTYHVVPGQVMSVDLTGKTMKAGTVQGDKVAIDGTDGIKVDGATVVTADVEASNGVIHVIDAVLLPPEFRGSF